MGKNISNVKGITIILANDITETGFEEKRDCYSDLEKYFYDDTNQYRGKICALYGLRRTGKTSMMEQFLYELPKELKDHSAYLTCTEDVDMYDLEESLDELSSKGINNFFIDEITAIPDFQGTSNILSDYFGKAGKVVIAGTDSLSIRLAMTDKLYDRVFSIHTSHIPYDEYSRLLGGKSLDEYIEYGGLLTNEPYKDNQNRDEYLDSSIVKNILHSMDTGYLGRKSWSSLTKFYEREQIQSAINKMVNAFSYQIVEDIVNRNYKNAPLYATKRNLKSMQYRNMLDITSANTEVRTNLGILNRDEVETPISEAHLAELKKYLKYLDLYVAIPNTLSLKNGPELEDNEILLQPGMAYAHTKELITVLSNDKLWMDSCTDENKEIFINRAMNYAKGEIMERIVLSETFLALGGGTSYNSPFYVSNLTLAPSDERVNYNGNGAEADMIIVDRRNNESYMFEIKHSSEVVLEQSKHLRNADFVEYVNNNFAPVKNVGVIYEGSSTIYEHIPYLHAEEFLKTINSLKTMELSEIDLNVLFPLEEAPTNPIPPQSHKEEPEPQKNASEIEDDENLDSVARALKRANQKLATQTGNSQKKQQNKTEDIEH